jgi:hypothetical protein
VSDIAPLTALVKLTRLNVRGCSSVSDLAPLGTMTNLQDRCTGVTDNESEDDSNSEGNGSSEGDGSSEDDASV